MIDVICENCKEPWGVHGLLNDDGLLNKITKENKDTIIKFGNRDQFTANFYLGLNEPEHFKLLRCECCKTEPQCPECDDVLIIEFFDSLNQVYKCTCGKNIFFEDTLYKPTLCPTCNSPKKDGHKLCFECSIEEEKALKNMIPKFVDVKFHCEYNGLIVYKNEKNYYFCHYWNEKKLYSATPYDGTSKFEASCSLKPDICLKLVKPMFCIKHKGIIKECFKNKKEAEKRLPDYDVYEWFNELYIEEINEVLNSNFK